MVALTCNTIFAVVDLGFDSKLIQLKTSLDITPLLYRASVVRYWATKEVAVAILYLFIYFLGSLQVFIMFMTL